MSERLNNIESQEMNKFLVKRSQRHKRCEPLDIREYLKDHPLRDAVSKFTEIANPHLYTQYYNRISGKFHLRYVDTGRAVESYKYEPSERQFKNVKRYRPMLSSSYHNHS